MLENYHFGLSPLQAVIIPVSDEFDDYAKQVYKKINEIGINCEIDLKIII